MLEPISLDADAGALIRAWAPDRPLAVLWSGGGGSPGHGAEAQSRWGRWTIIAEPVESIAATTVEAALGPSNVAIGGRPAGWGPGGEGPPFRGGWIGALSYELGRALEPAAAGPRRGAAATVARGEGWPLAIWHRCPAALALDGTTGRWWAVGDAGMAATMRDRVVGSRAGGDGFVLGAMNSRTGRAAYEASAARTIEYIRAGDIFQANIAHVLSGSLTGSARSLFASLAERTRPWFGAYLECPDGPDGTRRALVSASPELFLSVEGDSRRVVTRPMKGTRRAGAASDLAASPKDIAELNMIIDLMRNDLGRVCEIGSVRVDERRVIERHADAGTSNDHAVLQAVGTVSGRLRTGLSVKDVLAATFPGGSVTGAPKIRAMQIIDELEPFERGPYCGAIGWVGDDGSSAFSVAIRTAMLSGPGAGSALDSFGSGSTLEYPVGAGIVAESDPGAEWRETLDKAGAILSLAARGSR